MKPARFPLQERYSYFVKFRQDGAYYGMYVWALNEDEAKSQVNYHRGDVKIVQITQDQYRGRTFVEEMEE